MLKRITALSAIVVLVFAFSVTGYAKVSPSGEVITTEATTTSASDDSSSGSSSGSSSKSKSSSSSSGSSGSTNTSSTSPKTGFDITGAFIAVVTASGIALVAKKRFGEA